MPRALSIFCAVRRLYFIWLTSPMQAAPLTGRMPSDCANDTFSGPEAA